MPPVLWCTVPGTSNQAGLHSYLRIKFCI